MNPHTREPLLANLARRLNKPASIKRPFFPLAERAELPGA